MKIDVLYFQGCPNHLPAVALAKEVVAGLGITAQIQELQIATPTQAVEHRFLGSPSIHVNGLDIDPNAKARTDYSFSCRMYGQSPLPTKEMLQTAITNNT